MQVFQWQNRTIHFVGFILKIMIIQYIEAKVVAILQHLFLVFKSTFYQSNIWPKSCQWYLLEFTLHAQTFTEQSHHCNSSTIHNPPCYRWGPTPIHNAYKKMDNVDCGWKIQALLWSFNQTKHIYRPCNWAEQKRSNNTPTSNGRGSNRNIVKEIHETQPRHTCANKYRQEQPQGDIVQTLKTHNLSNNKPRVPYHRTIEHDADPTNFLKQIEAQFSNFHNCSSDPVTQI